MSTLLIGHPGVTWRGWLKENRGGRDLICLDPADHEQPRPTQLTHFRGEHPQDWRFYGTLDATRAPHVLLAAAARFRDSAELDTLIQAPAYRPGPVARQTVLLLAELLRPDRILIADGTELSHDGFTVGPETVELEPSFPPVVEAAQRKARWLGFIESSSEQELQLSRVSVQGARLGSGRALTLQELDRLLPGAAHAELAGGALFVVTDSPVDDQAANRALNACHATRLHTATEPDYANLVCGLARGMGEDFAFGIVRKVDFRRDTITLQSDAVPPAPATILRLGSLRVDAKGNECGETWPWTV